MGIPWIPKTPQERAEAIIQARENPEEQIQWEIPTQQTTYSMPTQQTTPYIEPSVRQPTQTQGYSWTPQEQTTQPSKAELIRTYLQQQSDLESLSNPDIETTSVSTSTSETGTEVKTSFWERALQLFAAPFDWIQSNVINPAFSIGLDAIIPNLEREAGEDYFEWKKREWEAWKTPGTTLNMPWGTWTIDVKGALELVPWLLIPGAGAVGSGIIKIGSKAGKLAGVAKAIGNAVRYSPWGLVEKGTGAIAKTAFSKLGKGADQISEAVSNRLFGKIEQAEVDPVIKKFTNFFTAHVGTKLEEKEVLKATQSKVRTAKLAQLSEDLRKGDITVEEWTKLSNQVRKGELESPLVPKEEIRFETGEIRQIRELLASSPKLRLHERTNAVNAFDRLVTGYEGFVQGTVPFKSEVKLFERALGKEFAESVGKFTKLPMSTGQKIIDALNISRATMASWDFSMILRQGLVLDLLVPQKVPKATINYFKATASEKLTQKMDDALRMRPLTQEALDNGLELLTVEKGAALPAHIEGFMSNYAEKIPGVRRSERGAVTFCNEMSLGAYEYYAPIMKAQGAAKEDLVGLCKFINAAIGRGNVPFTLEKYTPLLNAAFFSPRLQLSRLQLVGSLVSSNPYVRKLAWQGAMRFIGGGVGLISLLNVSGVAKTSVDPRSADFGKIVIGDTRLDIWTGYAQYSRFLAQMMTGQSVSESGNVSSISRYDTIFRFAQSKTSPALGLIVDLLKGQDYEGTPLFTDTTGVLTQLEKRLVPLFIQDMIDATEMNGMNAALLTVPEAFGIGAITYGNDVQKVQNKIARQMGLKDWDEIDPATQKKIESNSNELKAAIQTYNTRMMGTQWGDWRLAGNAIEEEFAESIDNACNEYRDTGDGYTFRDKVNLAFKSRSSAYDARSKDERFKEIVAIIEKPLTESEMANLGPEQLAIRIYQEALYNDDMYDSYGNYRFDEAEKRKTILREQLGNELFNYVEEYNGLKYEDLPAEYQDLVKARQILEPYWAVEQEAGKYFKTESLAKERFIARRRKILRRINKEMDYYYRKYYLRSE